MGLIVCALFIAAVNAGSISQFNNGNCSGTPAAALGFSNGQGVGSELGSMEITCNGTAAGSPYTGVGYAQLNGDCSQTGTPFPGVSGTCLEIVPNTISVLVDCSAMSLAGCVLALVVVMLSVVA